MIMQIYSWVSLIQACGERLWAWPRLSFGGFQQPGLQWGGEGNNLFLNSCLFAISSAFSHSTTFLKNGNVFHLVRFSIKFIRQFIVPIVKNRVFNLFVSFDLGFFCACAISLAGFLEIWVIFFFLDYFLFLSFQESFMYLLFPIDLITFYWILKNQIFLIRLENCFRNYIARVIHAICY